MNPEDTTTSTGQETVQAPSAQPEELETQQAVTEEDNSYVANSDVDTYDSAEDDTSSENQEDWSDEDYLNWANKKGIKTDDTVSMLKMVRGAEKKMHETTQNVESKQLRQAIAEADEINGMSDVDVALNRLAVREFYLDNPEAKQYDEAMAEIVREKPYLANDLDTIYLLAKAKNSNIEKDIIRKQAQKDALAQAAKAESAAPPQKSASTRQGVEDITDEDIANMSLSEYQAWRESSNYNPFGY